MLGFVGVWFGGFVDSVLGGVGWGGVVVVCGRCC